MPNPGQLPYQTNVDPINGGNARAIQNIVSSMPRFESKVFEAAYIEPMSLAVVAEPESIELTRLINMLSPDVPQQCSGMVHFTYRPEFGGALIKSIDGLTSDGASRYRFTFRITYKAQV